MSELKMFSLGSVLSLTDGKLLAPFDEVHELIEWLAGESVWTHQIPRVADEVKPYLLAQHPELKTVVVPEGLDSWAKTAAFLTELGLPLSLSVEPAPAQAHTSIDPVAELKMNHPGKPVIVVKPEDDK